MISSPAHSPFALITALALGVAWSLGIATAARSAPQAGTVEVVNRVLIDIDLRRRTVRDIELQPENIRFRDSGGRLATLPRSALLGLMPPDAADRTSADAESDAIVWRELSDLKTASTGRIELVDGQILPGAVATAAAETAGSVPADSVAWNHAVFGVLQLPLDRLSFVALGTAGLDALADTPSNDIVGLGNRDRVEGFVVALTPRVEISAGRDPITFPLSRVSFIRFANPRVPASGPRMWLHDGTVVTVGGFRSAPGGVVEVERPAAAVIQTPCRIPAAEITAISFDSRRLVPLSSLIRGRLPGPPRKDQERPDPAMLVAGDTAAPLDAADIDFTRPGKATWQLPPGARRIAGAAELPRNCRLWGDCTLIIETGAGEMFRERLNGSKPLAEFNLPIPAGADAVVTVTLDAGESGPVQDRVLLRRVLIAVDPPDAGVRPADRR